MFKNKKNFLKNNKAFKKVAGFIMQAKVQKGILSIALLVAAIAPNGCFEPVWHEEAEMPDDMKSKINEQKCFCLSNMIKRHKMD